MCPVCVHSEVLGVRNSLPNERLARVASIRTCREKPSKEIPPEECGIRMFVCLLMHLSVHLSLHPSANLYFHQSTDVSLHLPVCQPTISSISPSTRLPSIHSTIFPLIYLYTHLFICSSSYLATYLFTHWSTCSSTYPSALTFPLIDPPTYLLTLHLTHLHIHLLISPDLFSHPSTYLLINPLIQSPIFSSIHLPTSASVHPYICLPTHLPIIYSPSTQRFMCIHSSTCLSIHHIHRHIFIHLAI